MALLGNFSLCIRLGASDRRRIVWQLKYTAGIGYLRKVFFALIVQLTSCTIFFVIKKNPVYRFFLELVIHYYYFHSIKFSSIYRIVQWEHVLSHRTECVGGNLGIREEYMVFTYSSRICKSFV